MPRNKRKEVASAKENDGLMEKPNYGERKRARLSPMKTGSCYRCIYDIVALQQVI